MDRRWRCYSEGEFRYSSKEQLIDFCAEHMATDQWPAEQVRAHMEAVVPKLRHWNK
ncbi:MAG: zinc ribbon domain-containing protein [Lachnospiraceae bacterium]|nr:zinc ribbon domain-containing protein [Lachnospiraceae bacterium]